MQVVEITQALNLLKSRGIGIIVDDSSNLLKVVLFAAADSISEKYLNEMLNISASHVLVTLNSKRCQALELGPMQRNALEVNKSSWVLPLCESVEAREGIHTGISVADRVATIRILAAKEPNPKNLVKPGHIFPIKIADGGVLAKSAVHEAASDIATITSAQEVAVVIDLLDSNGEYINQTELAALAANMNIPVFNLSSIVLFKLRTEQLIEKIGEAQLPVNSGTVFKLTSYRSKLNGVEHIALSLGQDFDSRPVLTRVQREHLLTDIFEPLKQDHTSSLAKSIALLEKEGRGLIVYLRNVDQDSFLIDNKTIERDALFREYGIGAQIIKQSGAKQIELISSSAVIPEGLENFGLEITGVRQLK